VNIGENIGARQGAKTELDNLPGSFPVRVWYTEIQSHNWTKNEWQVNTGHFTQVIWSATKRIGCGRIITKEKCTKDGRVALSSFYIVVCRYYPPGNWRHPEAYREHVQPPNETYGKPNTVPNFTKYCPSNTNPCSRPILCCSKHYNVTSLKSSCISTTSLATILSCQPQQQQCQHHT
jgi:hypothetical protein